MKSLPHSSTLETTPSNDDNVKDEYVELERQFMAPADLVSTEDEEVASAGPILKTALCPALTLTDTAVPSKKKKGLKTCVILFLCLFLLFVAVMAITVMVAILVTKDRSRTTPKANAIKVNDPLGGNQTTQQVPSESPPDIFSIPNPTRAPSTSTLDTAPTESPSNRPSIRHSISQPVKNPTRAPSSTQSYVPLTSTPQNAPTRSPSRSHQAEPTESPSSSPSHSPPTNDPTLAPSNLPSSQPTFVSFTPGLLVESMLGLKLSRGLTARVLAISGQPVTYASGQQSNELFHELPDFGGVFEDERPWNAGGWIYTSNSENRTRGKGGVGALTFDANGNVIDYKRVLEATTANCGGGKTDWGAWISCEETRGGVNWQVDPTGERPPKVISLGNDTGVFESFARDIRNWTSPYFFVTEDKEEGALQRWRPFAPDWTDPWSILLGDGETDFLMLVPKNGNQNSGTFFWTKNRNAAKENAKLEYPHSEGIDVSGNQLFFVSKVLKMLIILDLDRGTYKKETTQRGLFNGGPDQLTPLLGKKQDQFLFFTEDGSQYSGIHARDELGRYFTLLESDVYEPETTGLAFSPDLVRMYFAFQVDGYVFEVTRLDGLPFSGTTLNVRYHVS